MVRKTFSRGCAQIVALVIVAGLGSEALARARQREPTGGAAVAEAVLWGLPMAPPERTSEMPPNVQAPLAEYRQRERMFRTGLKGSPGATPVEGALFEKRVGIERVVFSLFPRRDSARVAAAYASDSEVSYEWEGYADGPRREAAFIDRLLRDLPQPWLAPYLHLIAGHRKLCASQAEGPDSEAQRHALADEARRQIAHARDSGHALIRAAAEHLLATERCFER